MYSRRAWRQCSGRVGLGSKVAAGGKEFINLDSAPAIDSRRICPVGACVTLRPGRGTRGHVAVKQSGHAGGLPKGVVVSQSKTKNEK